MNVRITQTSNQIRESQTSETRQLVFGTNSNHLCVDSVEDENSELKAVNYKVK